MVFVDRYTVRMMGEVIAHGQDGRQGHPIRSVYERRKRARGGRSDAQKWATEFQRSGLSRKEAEEEAVNAAKELKTKEKDVRTLRRETADLERERTRASERLKQSDTEPASGSESGTEASFDSSPYGALVKTRNDLRDKRRELLTEEAKLREHRQDRYYWNKVAKAATSRGNVSSSRASQAVDTVPTWD